MTEKDGKTCLKAEKDDFNQQRRAKHLFAGQNNTNWISAEKEARIRSIENPARQKYF